jgi:phosphate transport system ATP-binding protein
MSHIVVDKLCVQYNGHPALQEVCLEIPDRQLTAVIGPSGCGKTTFLRCLNRLIDTMDYVKIKGGVRIDGEDIFAPGADVISLRRKMGLLSQKPQVLPMSIYDNVAYGPRLNGVRQRRTLDGVVRHCLEMSALWGEVEDRLRAPASGLSLGQQQRLCLARGLAVEPEALLCDEPTASLDPVSAQSVERLFMELKSQYTIVLVTHILRQAKRLADYIVFFYLGELVEHGPAEQVLNNPRDERTRKYLEGVIS